MMTEKNDIGMLLITKRDGRKVPFDINKIKNAIGKAFIETGKQIDDSILNMLALQSVAGIDINHEINVESIQDAVERTLMNAHFSNEAKAYILYRKQREYARNTKLDVDKVVGDYIGDIDWRVKENSTVQFSLGGLILAEAGAVTANYWLNHYYDEEIRNAHKNCDMHIHDLSMLSGYCAGWSLKQLILEGLGCVDSKISSKPARHLHTLCNQMVNFLGIMQNEWAGAQAFSSFDTYLAPFVKIDHLEYHHVKQCIQSFVFGVNTPSRWGTQPPFTNITLDWTCPDDLKNQPAIVGGVPQDFTYGDCKEEMDIINKAFIEVMMEGDADGRGFAYPIPTYSITKDFDWSDTENNELLFGMAAKYGSPYFSNYVNSDMEPSDIRSMAIMPDQNVIYRDESGRVSKTEISHLANSWLYAHDNEKPKYQMLMNGEFVDVTEMFKIPYDKYNFFNTVVLANGYRQRFSFDHKCAIIRNGVYMEERVQNLKPGDKFLLAKKSFNDDGYDETKFNEGYQSELTDHDYLLHSYSYRKGLYSKFIHESDEELPSFTTTSKDECDNLIELAASICKYFYYEETENGYKLSPIDLYDYDDNFYMIDIVNIIEEPSDYKFVYNFTVDTPEHLYTLPNGIITHQCCRLRLDLTELRKKNGGFFGSGESTGSVGVVTINLPKIGYEASDIDDFYRRLDKVMDIAAKSLDIKRRVITSLMEAGLYPYTKRYLGSFDNHFSTIGLVGMNECGLNAKWLHADMRDKRTQKWAEEILNHMRERLVIYQQKYGALFNLESTPAESTSYRFALHDKKRYPDIKTANENGTPYYTNSTNLPVGATDDVFEALDIQDSLQILYTSGTVFHTFLGEKLPSWKSAANLIRTITNNYRLPYITLSPTYSVCKDHGYLTGEKVKCPICGQDTEVYSRITGYYRPVKNWNDGKSQEYKDRKKYLIDESKTSACEEPIKEDIKDSNQSEMKQNEEMVSDVSITLLTKDHCPNCEVVKAYIKNSLDKETRSSIRILKAFIDPEADELIDKYKIMSIPTMIVSDGSHTIVVHTVERIIKYLEGLK